MLHVTILISVAGLTREFERCCRKYESLHIATAWCGKPYRDLPYTPLEQFRGEIQATVGRSFNHTHPRAIELLLKLKADVRVFRDDAELFHPKLYLFSSGKQRAIFIGSSNLTYGGFHGNKEINVLLEGVPDAGERAQLRELEEQLAAWHSNVFSDVPTSRWIAAYRKEFEKVLNTEKKVGINLATSPKETWLQSATWATYYGQVLKQHDRNVPEYLKVLNAALQGLPLPWKVAYFDDKRLRGIILGVGDYGLLGNVGAFGKFGQLLKNGPPKQRQTIVDTINEIGALDPPIDWNLVKRLLGRLVTLGPHPTMTVWGRLLSLVRPDLYCTVADGALRSKLSKLLGIPKYLFLEPEGYVRLLKLLHASPWFASSMPTHNDEAEVWQRRVAFMDAIFYTPKVKRKVLRPLRGLRMTGVLHGEMP